MVDSAQRIWDALAAVAEHGGPEPAEYEHVLSLIDGLVAASVPASVVRDALPDGVMSLDTMQGFGYLKPHGYAGDFEMIDRIYTQRISKQSDLRRWDEFFHAQPAPRAVRNRVQYLHQQVSQGLERNGDGRLSVLNVGSGPARDVYDFFAKQPAAAVRFTCVDTSEAAIAYAMSLCRPFKDRVIFEQANVMRYQSDELFDLVWSAGLFDYFDDRVFVLCLRRLLKSVRPGGKLVIGNFATGNPSRPWMELIGDWHLHHRTPEQLRSLAVKAGAETRQVDVDCESAGVNLFLHVRPDVER
jgi:SAM-dependent methyltransferase